MRPQPMKPPLTHFLGFPLVTSSSAPQWQASLDRFILDATASVPGAPANTAPASHAQSDEKLEGKTTGFSSTSDAVQTAVSSITNAATRHDLPPHLPLPAKAIMPLHTIHMTLGVMSLRERSEIEEATSLLKGIDLASLLHQSARGSELASSQHAPGISHGAMEPLHVAFRSLRPMLDAKSTSVLYAAPEEPSGRLRPFCQALRKAFMDKGLLEEDHRDLILHATIVNTVYARSKDRKKKIKARKLPPGWGRAYKSTAGGQHRQELGARSPRAAGTGNEEMSEEDGSDEEVAEEGASDKVMGQASGISSRGKLDGRRLIDKWQDHTWAELDLERVSIFEMGAKPDENGNVRYKEIAAVKL